MYLILLIILKVTYLSKRTRLVLDGYYGSGQLRLEKDSLQGNVQKIFLTKEAAWKVVSSAVKYVTTMIRDIEGNKNEIFIEPVYETVNNNVCMKVKYFRDNIMIGISTNRKQPGDKTYDIWLTISEWDALTCLSGAPRRLVREVQGEVFQKEHFKDTSYFKKDEPRNHFYLHHLWDIFEKRKKRCLVKSHLVPNCLFASMKEDKELMAKTLVRVIDVYHSPNLYTLGHYISGLFVWMLYKEQASPLNCPGCNNPDCYNH